MASDTTSAEKVMIAFGTTFLAVCGILFFVPLTTILGAITGWVMGWFFGDTLLSVLAQFGVHGITMWQFGAFMGFVGGFLKTKVTVLRNEVSR